MGNSVLPVLMIGFGGLLVWWALNELRIIGPNKALGYDPNTHERLPGGYTSPGTN